MTSSRVVDHEVTVVLCTYNGALHVREQVASILTQSLLPGTLIVADDGSRDGTLQLVEEQVGQHDGPKPLLVVLPPEDAPLGAARNFERALTLAETPFVALSDQDDVWHRDRLRRPMELLSSDPRLWLVATDTAFIDGEGASLPGGSFRRFRAGGLDPTALRSEDLLLTLARQNFVQGMTFTLRRELVSAARGGSDQFLHDYWLAINAAARGRMALLGEPLVLYRLHGRNVVGVGERRAAIRLIKRVHWFVTKPRRGESRRVLEWNEVERRVLDSPDLPLQLRTILRQKVAFERSRIRGSRTLLGQVGQVLRLVRRGEYRRFDRDGVRGAADDLLQPRSKGP